MQPWHVRNPSSHCLPIKSVCILTPLFVILHRFQDHMVLTRDLPRAFSISCPTQDLERKISKSFTASIGLRHAAANGQSLIKAGWQNIPLAFRPLAEVCKNNIIYLDHYCYCFMTLGRWKRNIWYRKRNITSFIFPSKMLKSLGIFFIRKLYAQARISAKVIFIS